MLCRDRIKIGKADDVQKRLSGIQTSNPDLVTIAFFEKVPAELAHEAEARAHEMLDENRVRGEWFATSVERAHAAVNAAIASAIVADRERPGALADARVVRERVIEFHRKRNKTEAEEILEDYPDEMADLTGYGRNNMWNR